MRNNLLKGLALTILASATIFSPNISNWMIHRHDGIKISVSQPKKGDRLKLDRVIFSGNSDRVINEQVARNSKEISVNKGEGFSVYFHMSDADGILEERLYVNGELKEGDNIKKFSKGYLSPMIGELSYFGKRLEYLNIGENTLRYEMTDTLGNIYTDTVNVNISE